MVHFTKVMVFGQFHYFFKQLDSFVDMYLLYFTVLVLLMSMYGKQ